MSRGGGVLYLQMNRKRDAPSGCGPGMPGPYKQPESLPQWNVGGGVLDAPQGGSLSRVTCRAASPLAAVEACGGGKCPGGIHPSPTNKKARAAPLGAALAVWIKLLILFAGGLHAQVVVQNALADAQVLGGDFKQLIGSQELKAALEAELGNGHQT